MIFKRIQLSVVGSFAQVFAYLVEAIRTRIEVYIARNRTGVTLPKGSIVILTNDGVNTPRAVRLCIAGPGQDIDYGGVLEEDIPDGEEGICRYDNEVYVRLVNGLDPVPATGDYVYASATPGVGQTGIIAGPTDILVGEVVDASGYNAAAPTGTTGVKVLLRYCCTELPN
jgi:hypothetical protein